MNHEDLVEAIDGLSEEERMALLDREMGWGHPGRKVQRVIAGILFALGSIWAVILFLSIFLLVGIFLSVVFMFGWLMYGGWFFVMRGERMSVSLRFFWTASIVVHGSYGALFTRSGLSEVTLAEPVAWLLQTGLAWWIPLGLSVVALGCEIWAQSSLRHGASEIDES